MEKSSMYYIKRSKDTKLKTETNFFITGLAELLSAPPPEIYRSLTGFFDAARNNP